MSSPILEQIKALCAEREITLAELERATGIGNGVIARWDRFSPQMRNLCKVADYLGVSLDALRGGEKQ